MKKQYTLDSDWFKMVLNIITIKFLDLANLLRNGITGNEQKKQFIEYYSTIDELLYSSVKKTGLALEIIADKLDVYGKMNEYYNLTLQFKKDLEISKEKEKTDVEEIIKNFDTEEKIEFLQDYIHVCNAEEIEEISQKIEDLKYQLKLESVEPRNEFTSKMNFGNGHIKEQIQRIHSLKRECLELIELKIEDVVEELDFQVYFKTINDHLKVISKYTGKSIKEILKKLNMLELYGTFFLVKEACRVQQYERHIHIKNTLEEKEEKGVNKMEKVLNVCLASYEVKDGMYHDLEIKLNDFNKKKILKEVREYYSKIDVEEYRICDSWLDGEDTEYLNKIMLMELNSFTDLYTLLNWVDSIKDIDEEDSLKALVYKYETGENIKTIIENCYYEEVQEVEDPREYLLNDTEEKEVPVWVRPLVYKMSNIEAMNFINVNEITDMVQYESKFYIVYPQ